MPARVKAFSIHLVLSLTVALLVLFLVFVLWYPAPLDIALSVRHVFLLLVAVDVILGPSFTLLVYKVGKKSLSMDLSIIVVVQFLALFYGLWAVAQGRPVWLVFNADRFDVVQAIDIDIRTDVVVPEKYRAQPWFGPQWVGAVVPQDVERRNAITFEAVLGGSDIAQRPDLYVPLIELEESIEQKTRELSELNSYNDKKTVFNELTKWPQATGWLPLMARAKPMVVLVGARPAQVLGVVNLNPW